MTLYRLDLRIFAKKFVGPRPSPERLLGMIEMLRYITGLIVSAGPNGEALHRFLLELTTELVALHAESLDTKEE